MAVLSSYQLLLVGRRQPLLLAVAACGAWVRIHAGRWVCAWCVIPCHWSFRAPALPTGSGKGPKLKGEETAVVDQVRTLLRQWRYVCLGTGGRRLSTHLSWAHPHRAMRRTEVPMQTRTSFENFWNPQ